MVILHILAPVQAGGLERVVHSLALGQRSIGHNVEAAAILDAEGEAAAFFPPLERAGVPVHRVVVPPRAYLSEQRQIRSLVETVSPEVVHSHGYRTDVVDGGLIRKLGVATVSTAHGFTAGSWRNRLYERLQRAALRRFDAVIAVSNALGESLRRSGVRPERLHVIRNAFVQIVDPLDRAAARAALGLPEDEFVVGWVGRMVSEKGLDILVDAAGLIAEQPPLFCAIGDGPNLEVQRRRVEEAGLADRFQWPGLVAEAARYLKAFDVFVLSSRTEGTPIALLEAIAAGVPVVATRVGGVPQVVGPEQALLVEPSAPADLAEAIRSARDDRQAADARAERAANRLRSEFGAESWLARHEEVYTAARGVRRGS